MENEPNHYEEKEPLFEKKEDENEEEFLEKIVEEYKKIEPRKQPDFKNEVRNYLYEEKKMSDREMVELLEEDRNNIVSWRRRNNLKPNYWERKTPIKKTPAKKRNEQYHRTKREKDLVVKFVLTALNYRKDNSTPEEKKSLREILDVCREEV